MDIPIASCSKIATFRADVTTSAPTDPFLAPPAKGNRYSATILNRDEANPVYIAGTAAGATEADGFPLVAGAAITLRYRGALYARAVGGTVNVAIICEEDI